MKHIQKPKCITLLEETIEIEPSEFDLLISVSVCQTLRATSTTTEKKP